MVVTEDTVDTVDTAVEIMTPNPQAKTVCNALRSEGRVINTDPSNIGFCIGATIC